MSAALLRGGDKAAKRSCHRTSASVVSRSSRRRRKEARPCRASDDPAASERRSKFAGSHLGKSTICRWPPQAGSRSRSALQHAPVGVTGHPLVDRGAAGGGRPQRLPRCWARTKSGREHVHATAGVRRPNEGPPSRGIHVRSARLRDMKMSSGRAAMVGFLPAATFCRPILNSAVSRKAQDPGRRGVAR